MEIKQEIKEIADKFNFKKEISFDSCIINIDNDIYFLTDATGKKYVIREAKRVREKDAEFETRLIESLTKHHFKTAGIVFSKEGYPLVTTKGNWPVFIFDFISGKQIEAEELYENPKDLSLLGGRALGEMHSIALRERKVIGKNNARDIFTEIDAVLKLPLEKLSHIKGFEDFLHTINVFKTKALISLEHNKEKCGAIHNDYGISNVIFNGQGCYVIDFDWSCYGPFIKDVGQGIALWSALDLVKGANQEVIKYFIEGYNQKAPFPVGFDKDLLFWICFSCLSDACTFFIGFLDGRFPGAKLERVEQCHGFKRFMCFEKLLRD